MRSSADRTRTERIWTWKRKLAGNLLPIVFWGLPVAVGIFHASKSGNPIGMPLAWLLGGMMAGWLSANYLGLLGNKDLRTRLRSLKRPPTDAFFVGFAPPGSLGLLDPHEDVGFLTMTEDRVAFSGENTEVALPKECVREVRFRSNPHSWAFLGRWVSIEGEMDGRKVRMLVEPREKPTLMGNRRFSRSLRDRIRNWAGLPNPGAAATTKRSR